MKNKFDLKHKIEIKFGNKKGVIQISTVKLPISTDEYCYETMLFQEDESEIDFELYNQWRYKTEKEASEKHLSLLEELKNGEYELLPITCRIKFNSEKR